MILSIFSCLLVSDAEQKARVDADDDGYINAELAGDDCDDADASVHPGAVETCDGIDQDCDGQVDNGVSTTAYVDTDGDGYGDAGAPVEVCAAAEGYALQAGDCDDGDATVSPSANEVCGGADENCDGEVDVGATDAQTWYLDADGDGHGDATVTLAACDEPEGYAEAGDDCDDGREDVFTGAEEGCDASEDLDCDGMVGPLDTDGDGWDACSDCDDADETVNPGGVELCNGVDDDCDGESDEDATDALTWYEDEDGDGFGDAPIQACEAPANHVATTGDCDDTDDAVFPGAEELCGGADADCLGDGDALATDPLTWYTDDDGDGYGSDEVILACTQPAGTSEAAGDCDDEDASTNPDATEVCDEADADEDCDGLADDDDPSATGQTTAWTDEDGDGYGGTAVVGCDPGAAATEVGDCDDADPEVFPDATEGCNGVDDDCDGAVDEGGTWFLDDDGDGYGDPAVAVCEGDADAVDNDDDCNDDNSSAYPGRSETCGNGVDNDCDPSTPDFCGEVSFGSLSMTFDASALSSQGLYGFYQDISGEHDFTGDGVDDIALGVYGQSDWDGGGMVILPGPYEGGERAVTADGHVWRGPSGEQTKGIAYAGSSSGTDDIDDVWVASAEGVYLLEYDGSSTEHEITDAPIVITAAAESTFGESIRSGDVDDDGEVDLIVGCYTRLFCNGYYGVIYAIKGPITASADAADLEHEYVYSADYLEHIVPVAVADLNGDGPDDLIISSYSYYGEPNSIGVLLGPVIGGEYEPDYSMEGTAGANNRVGVNDDVDGDGYPELTLTDPVYDYMAYVVDAGELADGEIGDLAWASVYGVPPDGPVHALLGDYNGDGAVEMAVEGGGNGDVKLIDVSAGGTYTGEDAHTTLVAPYSASSSQMLTTQVNGDDADDLFFVAVPGAYMSWDMDE